MGASHLNARNLAQITPESRNRYVDLLRVISIGMVVIGHWLLAVLGWDDGFTGDNLLVIAPSLHIATWVFQVMPLFFIVGGFVNGPSWQSARGRGAGYGGWLSARSTRLMRPAIVFVTFWTLVPSLAVLAGLPSDFARLGGSEVALPLWFLAVYLAMMILIPPLMALHRRWGAWAFVALALATLLIDIARYGLDLDWAGAPNFILVWLAMLELGVCWREGLLTGERWLPWVMAGGGLGILAVLTLGFDYPVPMIHLFGSPRSNAMPPTFALLTLGIWQCGAVLAFERPAKRWLQRPRAWLGVVVANSMIMTLYLWNMSAVVLAAVLLLPTGIWPQPEQLGAEWWVLRPLWILACAVCLAPFVVAFRWAERSVDASATKPVHAPAAVVGTVLGVAGMGVLAANAFPVPGQPSGIQAAAVLAIAVSAMSLRLDPFAPSRSLRGTRAPGA